MKHWLQSEYCSPKILWNLPDVNNGHKTLILSDLELNTQRKHLKGIESFRDQCAVAVWITC
jgi:hypothetical protein